MFDPLRMLRRTARASERAPSRRFERALADGAFAELVAMASRGEVGSGRPVDATVLDVELPEGWAARVETACDALERRGSERGVVLIGGRGLVLDVGGRRIESELDALDPDAVVSIDSAVRVAAPDEVLPERVTPVFGPAVPAPPPGIAAQLARRSDGSGLAGG